MNKYRRLVLVKSAKFQQINTSFTESIGRVNSILLPSPRLVTYPPRMMRHATIDPSQLPLDLTQLLPWSNVPGDEHPEDGARGQRPQRGGDPGQDAAADEGLREGGRGQHRRVQAALQAEEQGTGQGRDSTKGLLGGKSIATHLLKCCMCENSMLREYP